MEPTSPPPDSTSATRTVAAIDIGSNSIRLSVAQLLPEGRIEIIERLQRAVRLGQDTFRRGRLGGQSMRAAVDVLRDFKQMLELYKVERVRAVTTSAVREAANSDNFLDRVFMATGLTVEVIATSEESRLTVSAVRQAVGHALGVDEGQSLIADVGGGSTLLTLLENGEIDNWMSLRLGSIRLQEMLFTSQEPPDRSAELLRHHIAGVVSSAERSLNLAQVKSFIAAGGDVRFAAREAGKPTTSADLYTVARADLDRLVRRCARKTAEELAKLHGLPFAEAETLTPALLVYQALLHRTAVDQMIISRVSMRDGLVLELARHATGEEDAALVEGIIHSAIALGEKYRADLGHAQQVAEIALLLFDELQADHGLRPRHRLLLQVAALLHELGGYISPQAHHKHSFYLIRNSEIFGLTRQEVEIVAHIARYHRRSGPKLSHVEFMSLARESRVVISKLAAILRVADALSRSQIKPIKAIRLERQDDDLTIYLPSQRPLILEERALDIKRDMFEDIYGLRIRLEEA